MGELTNLNSSVPLSDADIPAVIARDSETAAAIAAHIATDHANSIPVGTPATISVSSIEDALRESYKSGFFAESHYLSTAGNGVFSSSSSNGGFAYVRAEPGYPGVLGLSTGSAANGAVGSTTGMGTNSSPILLADGETKYLGIVKIPNLRDSVNDFVVEVGFQSAGSSIGFDACCFVYDASSPNWQFHTRNNGDLTVIISNTSVLANTWYSMSIIVTNGIATFSINDTAQSTNNKLPLVTRMVGAGVDIRKIAGTIGRDVLIDYQRVSQKRNESLTTIPILTRTLVDADIPDSIARVSDIIEGPMGATGAQGIQGLKGDTGAQGIQGLKGDTGAQGTIGPVGPVGATGASAPGPSCIQVSIDRTYDGINFFTAYSNPGLPSWRYLGLTGVCHISSSVVSTAIPPGGFANGTPPSAANSALVQSVGSSHFTLLASSSSLQIVLKNGAFNIGQLMSFRILIWY